MKDIKNVRVNMVPVIDFDELECEFEHKKDEYAFYNRVDQYDGYFWVGTDEDDVQYLEDEIEEHLEAMKEHPDWNYTEYIEHLRNDLELVNALRAAGYDDGVIIYIWC